MLVKKLLVMAMLLLGALHPPAVFSACGGELRLQWIQTDSVQHANALPEVGIDSIQAEILILSFIDLLRKQGHLSAQVLKIERQDEAWAIRYFVGKRYSWGRIRLPEQQRDLWRQAGLRAVEMEGLKKRPDELSNMMLSIRQYLINQGYAFARINIDSLEIEGEELRGVLQVNAGKRVVFDTLEVRPAEVIRSSFLAAYLGIKPGTIFTERLVERMEPRLRRLSFLSLEEPIRLTFTEEGAKPILSVTERRMNQIDLIAGFLPNELDPGRLLLTGNVNLDLHNLFHSGKRLKLNWQKLRPQSQVLDLDYQHPGLFHSALGFHVNIGMLKEEEDFLNIGFETGLSYLSGTNGKLGFLAGNRRGIVPGIDVVSESLPSDLRFTFYGLSYEYRTTDDVFHPFRGLDLEARALVGNRRLLNQESMQENLDIGDLNTNKYEWELNTAYYQRIARRIVLKSRLDAGLIANPNLFINELFRLGGINSIRGFNDNFFFANRYALASVESRFYLDTNSYFFAFFDQAWLQYRTVARRFANEPSGLGFGLSFTTDAGIFNLALGIGRSRSQNFNPSNANIHIGYISRF
jgi:outer membrane protein assembly factor BamA